MARFTRPLRAAALSPGVKALVAIVAVALLLTVGQVALQSRMVEAQIAQAELQAQAEQARAELQVEMEQARIEAEIQAQNVAADRAALVALYNATDGPNWTNNTGWLTDQSLGAWHGISVNASGRVTRVVLGGNNLTGTLPDELGNLTDVQHFGFYNNNLTGSIPASLGNLSNLTHVTFYNNSLTGSIPASLGGLSMLVQLTLYNNSLTGTIPTELSNLSAQYMQSMDFSDNQLTGQLPYGFTKFNNMTFLRLHNNAGLCVPLDTDFQSFYQGITTRDGDDCPRTRIRAGTAAPVVGEPVIAELTAREDRLARISTTLDEYNSDPCIGYDDTRDVESGWAWRRSSTSSGPWFNANAGRHPHATFVYLPRASDVGMYLYAFMTINDVDHITDTVGPVVAAHGVPSGDIVSVAAPTGTVQVDNDLTASLPDAAAAERHDPAINPRLYPWVWERSDDGASDWTDVTPYHLNCAPSVSDAQYPLTTEDDGKHLRAYLYYNDDSSGSAILKRGEAASVGPVVP